MLARVDVRAIMSVSWSNERVLQLIDLYKNFECLWNTSHYDYKNKFKKRDAWDTIAKMMELPLKEVESKVHTLRSQFTRERKKLKTTNKTGSGNEDVVKMITWFAYEPLQFLLKIETSSNKDTNMSQMDDSISAVETQQLNTDEEQDSEFQQNDIFEARPKKRIVEDKINAYEVIKTKKRITESDGTDEFDVYGKYVASELRNIKDEYSTLIAKQYINNILIDARFGKYRQEFHSYGNAVNTPDPLTTSHLTPEIKIEERSHSINSEHGSQQNSVQDID